MRNYVVASGLERTVDKMTPEKRAEYEARMKKRGIPGPPEINEI